ncbi:MULTISPECIES: GNAT family N-acetyltransferase [unclassified Acinetobacter]|uniref:GNAT family N-acetyltransferase n=1 Tax=unclassified Acinetobacter TaxID=196816 RepID=UPI0035BA03D5
MATLSQTLPDNFDYSEEGITFSLIQVRYPEHLELLHRWMNMPHIIPQWQLDKPIAELAVYFEKMLADDHQRLYLVGIDGEWVGYTELYEGARDRLAGYYESHPEDLGWHLLLAEAQAFGKGYLRAIMRMLSFFIFEHSPNTHRIVGEPDASVKPYEVVAKQLMYMPQYLIKMPEKTAMLYYCDRQDFYASFAHYFTPAD